jgi:hypothetical protein
MLYIYRYLYFFVSYHSCIMHSSFVVAYALHIKIYSLVWFQPSDNAILNRRWNLQDFSLLVLSWKVFTAADRSMYRDELYYRFCFHYVFLSLLLLVIRLAFRLHSLPLVRSFTHHPVTISIAVFSDRMK